jgi:hypothetical protein
MINKMMALYQKHLKTTHDLELYPYQLILARQIFTALITNLQLTIHATEEDIKRLKPVEIQAEFSRQSGKTTAIVHAIEYIMLFFTEAYGKPLNIAIFAPQAEQAKTDFDRLKLALRKTEANLQTRGEAEDRFAKEESNAKTLVLPNGTSCYIFPVTKTSKPESKTLHLIIFEESQDLPDQIVKEQILPMRASTNAPVVWIGTAGTRICNFYRLGQGKDANKLYFEQIAAQRRQVYELTGNPLHLIYEQTIRGEIEKYGLESDEIQRPYFGKWLIGTGQFTTAEEIDAITTERGRTHHERKHTCFVGIDTAKHPDSTIVTVLRWNEELGKKELINWLELRGENYKDQFDIIVDFISRYNVIALAIDSTGQGDFMPDMFERETNFVDENNGLYRMKFSAVSKDIMYKNLKVSIQQLLTTLPKNSTKESEKFRQQMLDLQQEYRGQLLSVHHPDDPNAHDDYADSWALAEYAYAKEQERSYANLTVVESSHVEKTTKSDFFNEQWD